MKGFAVIVAAVCLMSLAAAGWATLPRYTAIDLGTLGGNFSGPSAINDLGQVVGISRTSSGQYHSFLWTPESGMGDLGTLGGTETGARDINNAGQVVGYSYTSSGEMHSFLWSSESGMVDLSAFGWVSDGVEDINDSGTITGKSADGNHAVLWTAAGGMVDIGTLGGQNTYASRLNNLGQVVGRSLNRDGIMCPFLWEAGTGMVNLSSVGGILYGGGGSASDINNQGQVVGYNWLALPSDPGSYFTASLWDASGRHDLGTLGGPYSRASSINDLGQAVGESLDSLGAWRFFMWEKGTGMVDLDSLIDAPPVWSSGVAPQIDDAGRIIAEGQTATGEYHAFLLTPVPEPSSAGVLIAGMAGTSMILGLRRRR